MGLNSTEQSRSLKYVLIVFLISFFLLFISSISPPRVVYSTFFNAFSRYYRELISLSSSSTNWSAKSLTTHMNLGKYRASCTWSSSWRLEGLAFTWMCLLKLHTRERLSRAVSSMAVMQLKMKYEERRIERVKILVSSYWSRSQEFKPSVSKRIAWRSSVTLIGLPHIQRPRVQDWTVEPISNPIESGPCFPSIRFSRKLFPVLYGPATQIIAIFWL